MKITAIRVSNEIHGVCTVCCLFQCPDLLLLMNVPSFIFQSSEEQVRLRVYTMVHTRVPSLEPHVTAQSAADRLQILPFYRK